MPSTRDVVVEDYGEDGYDRYLYASGRPNRVVVNDIYTESVAASAGLQSGDMVVAMDNQRIYSTRDLRNIAASGLEGETVSVTILRDGQPFEIYVPRGPLGIRSERGFENPAAQP